MEARDIIFSVVLVFSAFVLAYKVYERYVDPAMALSVVVLAGMVALLFLSIDERMRKLEQGMSERERSLRVSLQSVEEEVRDKIGSAAKRFEEVREEILKRGYR